MHSRVDAHGWHDTQYYSTDRLVSLELQQRNGKGSEEKEECVEFKGWFFKNFFAGQILSSIFKISIMSTN